MTVSSQFPVQETLKQPRSRVLTVMSAMRSLGYGGEDIRETLMGMGHDVPLKDCLRFVLGPKRTAAPERGASQRGR